MPALRTEPVKRRFPHWIASGSTTHKPATPYNPAMSFAFFASCLALLFPGHLARPMGYLAMPKSGHGRGVLVLHAWWGLNGDVRHFCDRLAKAGFIAFAPDLFQGKVVTKEEEAKKLVEEHDAHQTQVLAQVNQAARFVAGRSGNPGIGVVGFSFGAYYALALSNIDPDNVRATAVYYGTGQQNFRLSKSSYLGNFAEHDQFEPKENVAALKSLLKSTGRPFTAYIYPRTGHWFAEPSVKKAYNKSAAELAWDRTVQFLKKTLE